MHPNPIHHPAELEKQDQPDHVPNIAQPSQIHHHMLRIVKILLPIHSFHLAFSSQRHQQHPIHPHRRFHQSSHHHNVLKPIHRVAKPHRPSLPLRRHRRKQKLFLSLTSIAQPHDPRHKTAPRAARTFFLREIRLLQLRTRRQKRALIVFQNSSPFSKQIRSQRLFRRSTAQNELLDEAKIDIVVIRRRLHFPARGNAQDLRLSRAGEGVTRIPSCKTSLCRCMATSSYRFCCSHMSKSVSHEFNTAKTGEENTEATRSTMS